MREKVILIIEDSHRLAVTEALRQGIGELGALVFVDGRILKGGHWNLGTVDRAVNGDANFELDGSDSGFVEARIGEDESSESLLLGVTVGVLPFKEAVGCVGDPNSRLFALSPSRLGLGEQAQLLFHVLRLLSGEYGLSGHGEGDDDRENNHHQLVEGKSEES